MKRKKRIYAFADFLFLSFGIYCHCENVRNLFMLLCSYLGTFIFLTFTLCSFLSSACSSRMAFTFVWRNKSKQKYALLN